jgi:hypothetical protein
LINRLILGVKAGSKASIITYSYTADDGSYEGGGTLSKDLFEGYYKGPIDGTYKMWRIK